MHHPDLKYTPVIRTGVNAMEDARFWNRVAQKYAQKAVADRVGYERTLNRTRDYLASGDRVLELGCGTGTTARLLADSVQFYLATDISSGMIAIAQREHLKENLPELRFEIATAEFVTDSPPFNAILGYNYLHLVRDLPATLQRIHSLLVPEGLFISKTPCVGDMNAFIRFSIPVLRAVGKAPYAGIFRGAELEQQIIRAGFDILAVENHASKGNEFRPYIVARKK